MTARTLPQPAARSRPGSGRKARSALLRWTLIRSALLLFAALSAFPARAGISADVEGEDFFTGRRIKEVLAPPPENYTTAELEGWKDEAVFQITELYHESGFFDAKVKVDLERQGNEKRDFDARIRIEEGQRYKYDTVTFVMPKGGPNLLDDPDLREDLEVVRGRPYKRDDVYADKRVLQQAYGEAGFLHAQVDEKVEIKPEGRIVSVAFAISPGKALVFDTLVVRNLTVDPNDTLQGITRHGLLRGLVDYKRGDTMRVGTNDKIVAKLQSTGVFAYARLRDSLIGGTDENGGTVRGGGDTATGGRYALVLEAEERTPGRTRTSIFFENRYGAGVQGEVSHRNISGTLNELRLSTNFSQNRQVFGAGYGSPLTRGYLLRFDNDLQSSWYQDNSLHDSLGTGILDGDFEASNTTRLSRSFGTRLRAVSSAEIPARSRLLEPELRERGASLNWVTTGYLSYLDNLLDPIVGHRYSLSYGNGGPITRQNTFRLDPFQSRHNWLEAQSAAYYPILKQLKLAARLDGGRFFGQGSLNADRFFLGGSRSVRAFGFRDLCPTKTASGVCITEGIEPAYYQASVELRTDLFDFGFIDPYSFWKIFIPLQIVPFADYGRVWNLGPNPPDPPALAEPLDHRAGNGEGWDYGFGFRYPLFGIFRLRLDFAFGENGNGNEAFNWVVDLAQAF